MEFKKIVTVQKDSRLLRRDSVNLARNTILLTMAVTSGIWLVLDVFLFYSSGFMSTPDKSNDDYKMPTDRRQRYAEETDLMFSNETLPDFHAAESQKKEQEPKYLHQLYREKLLDKLRAASETKPSKDDELGKNIMKGINVAQSDNSAERQRSNKAADNFKKDLIKYETVLLYLKAFCVKTCMYMCNEINA